MATATVDGRYPVDSDKRMLALKCWGEGSTVVVFDAGSGDEGIARWSGSPILRDLARHTRVCTYDRAGLGLSDPAPDRARLLDDVVNDLHELLRAAQVPPPYLLVGSSVGGFDEYHHAGRYPDEMAGLVLLDVPPGQAQMSAADVAELAWNRPGKMEHVD
jgi:pimeloyl-ACP methyl ester carboxylesterase